jgi:hypothetical protein
MERITDIMCRRKPDSNAKKLVAVAYALSFKFGFMLVLTVTIALGHQWM